MKNLLHPYYRAEFFGRVAFLSPAILVLIFAAMFAALVWSQRDRPATAASWDAIARCGDWPAMVRQLERKHHEKPAWSARSSRGHRLYVFTNSDRTWTMVARHRRDMACIVGSGIAWRPYDGGLW